MKISYNWLKSYIPEISEPEKLWHVFTFHLCEVEGIDKTEDGDTIFDINILPNRAHDLLSHQGVAQELAALLSIEYKSPIEMYKTPESKPTELVVKIESDKCRRYMGRIVRNVKVGPSPDWVVKHLESIGQKSINNVVDATNIVLFDCGQPTHVFDMSKVKGQKSEFEIRIQNAKDGEKIQLLGGEEKELKEGDLVIADGEGNALAIAGVKGGAKAEVDENTTDIILEVANFEPASTRKTGRRLSLFTDALKRFENDLSPVRAEYAMTELSAMILEMCPDAVFEDVVDVFPASDEWNKKRAVGVSLDFVNNKLGTDFSSEEIENVWKRMKFSYSKDGGNFVIEVPPLRLDLEGPHDLVEEVGRVLGYESVDPKLPKIPFTPKINPIAFRILLARKKLVQLGFREVYTYTFTKKGKTEVSYGAKGKEALRTNISDGLKAAYEQNRLNAPYLEIDPKELALFEIGHVYPNELGVNGDFGDVSPEVVNVAWIDKSGAYEMTLEEYTKDIELAQSYDEVLGNNRQNTETEIFAPWSTFPFVYRDISMWVPKETDSQDVVKVIKDSTGDLVVKGPTLIDSFEKDGRRSLAFRIVFQAEDRTLTDEEVSKNMKNVEKAVLESGFEIR